MESAYFLCFRLPESNSAAVTREPVVDQVYRLVSAGVSAPDIQYACRGGHSERVPLYRGSGAMDEVEGQ